MKILLDEIMSKRGLTLGQVSAMTGVQKSTLHHLIRKNNSTLVTLEKIAKGLHISISDLFESEYK